jgi:hypothetical protein
MSESIIILVTIRQCSDHRYEALIEGDAGDNWPIVSDVDPASAAIGWLEALSVALSEPSDLAEEFEEMEVTMRRVAEVGGEIHFQPQSLPL